MIIRTVIIPIVLAVLVVVFSQPICIMLCDSDTEQEVNNINNESKLTDDVWDCFEDIELKLFGTSWCGYCQQQIDMFDEVDLDKLDYINCEDDMVLCQDYNITGYPTWLINTTGDMVMGQKTIDGLITWSGCG